MSKTLSLARAATFALLCVTGCDVSEGAAPAPEMNGDLVQRTSVLLPDEGSAQVVTEMVPPSRIEEMKQARAARAAQPAGFAQVPAATAALVADGWCGDSSIWLFDGPGLTGNMLCLMRSGASSPQGDSLFSYRRPGLAATWAASVRSYWAGADAGYFRMTYGANEPDNFHAWQRVDQVSDVVKNAYVLFLNSPGDRVSVPVEWHSYGPGFCFPPRIPVAWGPLDASEPIQVKTLYTDQYENGCASRTTVQLTRGETYDFGSGCHVWVTDAGIAMGTSSSTMTTASSTGWLIVTSECRPE